MKKIFTCFLIIYAIFLSGCPKEKAVRRAAKASYQLSGLTLDAVNATAKAFEANIIDIHTKDKIAENLKLISIGGKRFNQTLEKFVSENQSENLPADKLSVLNLIFSQEIVAPFLEILQKVKLVTAQNAAYLQTAINALRTAILLISDGFSAAKAEFTGEVHNGNTYA